MNDTDWLRKAFRTRRQGGCLVLFVAVGAALAALGIHAVALASLAPPG